MKQTILTKKSNTKFHHFGEIKQIQFLYFRLDQINFTQSIKGKKQPMVWQKNNSNQMTIYTCR